MVALCLVELGLLLVCQSLLLLGPREGGGVYVVKQPYNKDEDNRRYVNHTT